MIEPPVELAWLFPDLRESHGHEVAINREEPAI